MVDPYIFVDVNDNYFSEPSKALAQGNDYARKIVPVVQKVSGIAQVLYRYRKGTVSHEMQSFVQNNLHQLVRHTSTDDIINCVYDAGRKAQLMEDFPDVGPGAGVPDVPKVFRDEIHRRMNLASQ